MFKRMPLTFDEVLEYDKLYLIYTLSIFSYKTHYSYSIVYWNNDVKCTSQVEANTKYHAITPGMITMMINLEYISINDVEDSMCLDIPRNEGMAITISNCPNITFVNRD